ncbi:MAG: hypothetical protein KDD33_10630 [Bdellovibrionales bacterium]|nr:hypothetical protein [Bdellovibrionales bacterium]
MRQSFWGLLLVPLMSLTLISCSSGLSDSTETPSTSITQYKGFEYDLYLSLLSQGMTSTEASALVDAGSFHASSNQMSKIEGAESRRYMGAALSLIHSSHLFPSDARKLNAIAAFYSAHTRATSLQADSAQELLLAMAEAAAEAADSFHDSRFSAANNALAAKQMGIGMMVALDNLSYNDTGVALVTRQVLLAFTEAVLNDNVLELAADDLLGNMALGAIETMTEISPLRISGAQQVTIVNDLLHDLEVTLTNHGEIPGICRDSVIDNLSAASRVQFQDKELPERANINARKGPQSGDSACP